MLMSVGGFRVPAGPRNMLRDVPTGRFKARFDACPEDFEEVLIRIGRLACQDHYGVGRATVDRWLATHGKERLIAARAAHVAARDSERRLNRREMARVLADAFPTPTGSLYSEEVVQQAAQFMRLSRNGGWPVSKSADGFWMIGISRKTADELVSIAIGKGFSPNLTGGSDTEIG
jgi:hypothetical protein